MHSLLRFLTRRDCLLWRRPLRVAVCGDGHEKWSSTSSGSQRVSSTTTTTILPDEIERFDRLSNVWWDLERGWLRPLHQYVPLRVAFLVTQSRYLSEEAKKVECRRRCLYRRIQTSLLEPIRMLGVKWREITGIPSLLRESKSCASGRLKGMRILDVGCGGGILAERLAAEGAEVTAIDAARQAIQVAERHRDNAVPEGIASRLVYKACELSELNREKLFDVAVASEVIEHVSNPQQLMADLSDSVKDGGMVLITTISKNPIGGLIAIVGGEYVLNLIERGTHHYSMLVSPSQLRRFGRNVGLRPVALQGTCYLPYIGRWLPVPSTAVTYMAAFQKCSDSDCRLT